MRVLSKTYYRCFIALLLMTVLYGKPVVCAVWKALATQTVQPATEEIAAEDTEKNETEKGHSLKGCKKPCPDIETGEVLIAVHAQMPDIPGLLTLHPCAALQKHFQQVPTPPPLRSAA